MSLNFIAMNKAFNFLLALSFSALLLVGCEKEPILEVSQSSLTFTDQGGAQTISFSTNKDWTTSVSGGTGWCTITPANGNSTIKSIFVSVIPNDTYEDRSATITIKADELTKVIAISQPKNKAIILLKKTNYLSFFSQTLEVEFKTNVDFEIIIPESSKGWVYSSNTKALRTEKLLLNISENTSNQARYAEVYIKDKITSLQDTLTFTQYEQNAYYVNEMGTLGALINQVQKDTISIMIIKGEINKADFDVMKNQMPKLSHLDLKNVKCEKDEIPDEAFSNELIYKPNKTLKTIVLPESITNIGKRAFAFCHALTGSLNIPSGITTIGNYAFLGCRGLVGSLNLPEKVTKIGEGAFADCTGLTGELIIPSGLTIIESSAFAGCEGFVGSLNLPSGLITIGEYAFELCTGFKGSLNLPSGVNTIGDSAFRGCTGFKGSLNLPSGVTTIGESAFRGCTGFTGPLNLPSSITNIDGAAFYGCTGFTGSLTLPSGIKTIGNGAFANCTGFTGSLTLPTSLTKIGGSAFQNCSGFTGSLTLPTSLTEIGGSAFQNCSGFTGSLVIPSGISKIEPATFYNCSGFNGTLTLPNGLKSIDDSAFLQTNFTGSLLIPNEVEYIGNSAFFSCDKFTGSLILPSGLTAIQEYAFYGCWGFNGSLILPEGIKKIGDSAFASTGFTGTLTLPRELTTIDRYAFQSCYFTGLRFGDNLVSISESAFAYCRFITGNVVFPMSLNSIKAGAFNSCNKVNAFQFPHSVPIRFVYNMIPIYIPVKVPSSAVALYESIDGWKNYNIIGY